MALRPETDFTQIFKLLNWTVPLGLVLLLRCTPPLVVAYIRTDRELMCVIFNFPNPNLRLLTLMVLGVDTVVLHRPS